MNSATVAMSRQAQTLFKNGPSKDDIPLDTEPP